MSKRATRKLIFVCTGNYYRSRLAEVLFNHYASKCHLEWAASSRGLMKVGDIQGLSPTTIAYLERRQLSELADTTRDPIVLKVEDLETANLIVALNREEHEKMLKQQFGQIPGILHRGGKLRYWNVYDLPPESNWLSQLLGTSPSAGGQREESGTEHIDFAVQALVYELKASG